jgi:hypothetical protein
VALAALILTIFNGSLVPRREASAAVSFLFLAPFALAMIAGFAGLGGCLSRLIARIPEPGLARSVSIAMFAIGFLFAVPVLLYRLLDFRWCGPLMAIGLAVAWIWCIFKLRSCNRALRKALAMARSQRDSA